MFTTIFEMKWLLLVMFISLITSSARAELVNVGPMDRVYENLLFDGYIKSGDKTLNILSGISDYQQNNSNGYGIWKSNINADNNWKFTPTNSWLNAAVINYNFPEDDIYGKPDKIITDRNTSDINTNDPTTAKFIWAANPGGSEDGRNGPEKAYFSYNFNLEDTYFDPKNSLSASAKVLADDFFAMSVNGHFVANGLLDNQINENLQNWKDAHNQSSTGFNGLGRPIDVKFSEWLKPGSNTISIFVYDGYKVEQKNLINSDTVKAAIISAPTPNNPETLEIIYSPSNNAIVTLKNITISDASDILGYDHFNWYQVVTGDKVNPGLCSKNPCTDPPINYLTGYPWDSTNKADLMPFYWDECTTDSNGNIGSEEFIKCKEKASTYLNKITENTINNTAKQIFSDSPQINARSFNNKLTFDTFFAGVIDHKTVKDQWDPIYHLNWELPKGAVISIVGDTETDNKVKACMLNDGARISYTESTNCLASAVVSEPPEWSLIILGIFLIKRIFISNTSKKYFLLNQ